MKKIKKDDYQIFIDWCTNQRLLVKYNEEVFFVDEKFLIKPEFIVNNRVYIDIINENDITPLYLGFCERFAMSFGAIMVIPENIINEFNDINKKTLETHFDFKF